MPVIDRQFFKQNFPKGSLFGASYTDDRTRGCEGIFDVWDEIAGGHPVEGLAYGLATAWHETGATMLPVREGFAKTDAEAVAHVTAYCAGKGIPNYAARAPNGNSYYGRGYVQLTHADNYKKLGKRLGFGEDLFDHPDRVMEPAVAGKILLVGLIEGSFRPARGKLSDYFGNGLARWFEAREMVNGDKDKTPKWAKPKNIGTLIADYGQGFAGALRYI